RQPDSTFRRNQVPTPEQKRFCEDKADAVSGLLLAQKGVFLLHRRQTPTDHERRRVVQILVHPSPLPPMDRQPVEFVERKGVGHPDTLCDKAAEELSIALMQYYLQEFGSLRHYNVDKALLVGGAAEVGFGRGRVTRPIELM